jgi:hypothetical protein
MRSLMRWVMLWGWLGAASAQSPLPDESARLFAGEWAGIGGQSSYCYLSLTADGRGQVLVDGGAGDWQVARIRWRNSKQSLLVEKIIPAPPSPALRVMPLEELSLHSGFNQSMSLSWNKGTGACQLQRTDTAARQLDRARSTLAQLPFGAGER